MYFLELLGMLQIVPFTLLMAYIRRWPSYSRRLWKTTENWRRFVVQLQFQFASVVVISSGSVPEHSCH